MPMRTDCRHYESRTYSSGEMVRKCRLDLAPEAPWRCPTDCPMFELRRMDVGWQYGSFAAGGEAPAREPGGREDDGVAALLNAAEDVVNSAAPEILAEFRGKGGRGKRKRRKKR
jgi:hypothetical protein